MSYDNWLSAYYVNKFIKTSRNSSNKPLPLAVGSSIMIRQLGEFCRVSGVTCVMTLTLSILPCDVPAKDRAFRREVVRERRRHLRAAQDGGAWQDWMLTSSLTDYGEEDWFSDQEEEEEERTVSTADINSAVLRESRLRVMRELPKCADQEMAERYRIIKQVKNDEISEVKTKTEWNTLRKRLISAKIREIVDEKIRLADILYLYFFLKTTTTFIFIL